jgi:3-hydroxyacyl-[acyl-carrier-protein] dehydratase
MSVLQKEIRALLRQVASHPDGSITAEITFPESFTGFKGHFPNQPVVPGVCKVLCVLVLLELVLKKKVRLKKIILAKFLALVTCQEKVRIELRLEKKGDSAGVVKALYFSTDKKIAEIQLEVNYA